MELTSKPARWVGIAAVAALSLTACSLNGSGSSQSSGAGGKSTDDTLVAAMIGTEIKSIIGPRNPGSQIGMALCEGLTRLDAKNGVEMAAAKSVSTKDNKTWTVQLQPDRTFDDGEKITAQTWVNSFNFVAYGPNGLTSNYAYQPIQGYDALNPADGSTPKTKELSGLKVTGTDSFTITMANPNNDLPSMLSTLPFCPMPKSAFADPTAFDKKPIGNGPYRLTSLDPKKEVVVQWNDSYRGWRQPDSARSIEFKIYNDPNTAYNDIAAGNVDIMRNLPPALTAQAKKTLGDKRLTAMPDHVLAEYLTWPTYLNSSFPKDVRVAVSQIIDRESIAKNLFLGSSLPAYSLVPNSVASFRPDACGTPCSFDPTAAKTALGKAGFSKTVPVFYASDGSNATTDAATVSAMTNEAKKIGLQIQPRPTPGNQLTEMVTKHELTGPTVATWGSSFPGSSEWLASVYVDANYGLKYQNAQGQAAVVRALAATDPAEATKAWHEVEDSILADQVMQPLFYQVEYIPHGECWKPNASGGDMVIYRTSNTC